MRTILLALTAGAFALPTPATGAPPAEGEKARALIVTGANNHAWKETTAVLKQLLEDGGFRVDVSDDPEAPAFDDPKALGGYQVVVLNLNRNKRWNQAREEAFLNYVRDGGGLVVFHAADNAFPGWDEFDRLVGGTWRSKGTSFPERSTFHPPYGPFEVKVVDAGHPITSGLGATFRTTDEMYTNLKLQDNIHVLAQGEYQGKAQPLLFVSTYGKGRVFQTALGHDLKAMGNPAFRETFVRGARWASAAAAPGAK